MNVKAIFQVLMVMLAGLSISLTAEAQPRYSLIAQGYPNLIFLEPEITASPPPDGEGLYAAGTVVTLTAEETFDTGNTILKLSYYLVSDGDETEEPVYEDTTAVVTMNSNMSVVFVYAEPSGLYYKYSGGQNWSLLSDCMFVAMGSVLQYKADASGGGASFTAAFPDGKQRQQRGGQIVLQPQACVGLPGGRGG